MTTVLLVVAFKCEQDKECADFAQGVYIDVHDQGDAERDCLLCSLFVVAFKCEQDKECEHRRRERT